MHGLKLLLDDFLYLRQKVTPQMADNREIKWVCAKYRFNKCNAKARTVANGIEFNGVDDHNHAAEKSIPAGRLVDMTKFDFHELFCK